MPGTTGIPLYHFVCWLNPNSYLFLSKPTPISHCSMSCSKTTVDPKQVHLSSALTVLLGDHSSATWASRRETVPGHFPWEKCWYQGHFNPAFGYRLSLKLNNYSILWPIKKVGIFNVSSPDFKKHPIFRQTLVSRIDGLAHVIWLNGKCRGNHVSLWIFSFKAQARIRGVPRTTMFELSCRSVLALHEESEHN